MGQSVAESVVNVARRTARDEVVALADQITLVPGFYGKVRLEWDVKEGTIAGQVRLIPERQFNMP